MSYVSSLSYGTPFSSAPAYPAPALSYSAVPGYAAAAPTYAAAPATVAYTVFKILAVHIDISYLILFFQAQAPGPVAISESEGNAPEGTPLSFELCQRLGVPHGTLWGLPAGQHRPADATAQAPAAAASPNLAKSTSSLPDDANKHSKTIEV